MGRVAIYLPSLGGGGAERITITLALALARSGHDVDLVVADARGPYLGEVPASIRLIDLRKRRVASSLPALAAYLRRDPPDVLLSGMGHANLIAIIARRLAGGTTRVVVTEHNSILRGLDTPKGRVIKWLMRRLYRSADTIVCVSEGIARELHDLLGLPNDKLRTIYNPVDIDGIRARATHRPDHPWFAAGQPPVVIGVGRLTAQKDFGTLLRAFAQVRAHRAARLVILGEGEDEAALVRQAAALGIAEDVAIPGFQSNPYAWMASSALYVMSSAWEGLPGVLLEAMACGTPIVSTDCRTGPGEILEAGRWGRLVPVGEATALAHAMVAALDDPSPIDASARIERFRTEHALRGYEHVLFG